MMIRTLATLGLGATLAVTLTAIAPSVLDHGAPAGGVGEADGAGAVESPVERAPGCPNLTRVRPPRRHWPRLMPPAVSWSTGP